MASRNPAHWLPRVVVAAGIAIGLFLLAIDRFGLTAPGMGTAQLALVAVALLLTAGGLVLQILHRRGALELPAWPLPDDAPAGSYGVVLAVWFGMAAGLLDPLILRTQNLIGMRFIYINSHVSWMSPLSYTGFFLIAVLVISVGARGRWRWLKSVRGLTSALVIIATGSLLLLLHPELHMAAILLVAVGLGVQGFRVLERRAASWQRFVRRSSPVLVIAILGATALTVWLPVVIEARRLGRLPGAPDAPNVLLIILDTVRGANVSFNGYTRRTTPNLERRASAGVVFERGVSASSWSAPGHAALVTGRYPFELTVDWLSPLSDEHPTLAERLTANGFRTGGFFANRLFGGRHTGLDRGALHWDVDRVSPAAVLGASMIGLVIIDPRRFGRGIANENRLSQKTAPDVVDEFLDWSADNRERPFFAMLNFMDAHGPYDDAPPPFDALFGAEDRPDLPRHPRWTAAQIQADLDGYDRSIAYLDAEVEKLLEELDRRGVLDSTIVIVTSDHGEEFGEKYEIAHGNSLNFAGLHVPLLLWGPGVPSGVRMHTPVSTRDIPATIVDLVGADRGEPLPGRSLRRFWANGDSARSMVFAAVSGRGWLPDEGERRFGNLLAAVSGRLKYNRFGTQRDESLFDLEADPWELQDLSGLPGYREDLLRFRLATDSIAESYMARDPLNRD